MLVETQTGTIAYLIQISMVFTMFTGMPSSY